MYQGETLGVLDMFGREPAPDDAPVWFRMIVDHVTVAIANARPCEEIEMFGLFRRPAELLGIKPTTILFRIKKIVVEKSG